MPKGDGLAERNRARATHGHTRAGSVSPTWVTWRAVMQRAHAGTSKDAARYLDRGITVCERWHDFENFLADMGERPEGMTLDRIDGTKGYEPGNCRWATPKEQARNRKSAVLLTACGRTQHVTDWARESGLSHQLIRHRLRAGWSPDEAVTTPASRSANSKWRRNQ